MTFEEFQATRRHVADIATEIGTDWGGEPQSGFVYADGLHIHDVSPGIYALIIYNEQTVSGDLGQLERALYDFAVDEFGEFNY